jgi:ABC-type sugar transport system substrate-binding protein
MSRYHGHRYAAALAALLACVGTAGCGGSSNSSSSTAASSPATTSSQAGHQVQQIVSEATQGLVAAPGDGDIAAGSIRPLSTFIGPSPVKPPSGHYRAMIVECAPVGGCLNTADDVAAVLRKLGWSVTTGAGDGSPTSYQSLFATALAQRANAIIAIAVPAIAVSQQLQQAKAKGIVTIASNTTPATGPGYTGYVDGREALSKVLLAASMIVESGGKAHPIFTDVVGGDLGVKAGVDFIKRYCPQCTVDRVSWNAPDFLNPVTAQQKAQSLVSSNPSANYLVWPTDGLPLQPVVQAIAQAGKSSSLRFVSSDFDPTAVPLLRSSSVHMLTALSHEWLAFATVDATLRGIEHQPIPASDVWGIGIGLVGVNSLPAGSVSYGDIDRYVQHKLDFVAPYQQAWGIDLSHLG